MDNVQVFVHYHVQLLVNRMQRWRVHFEAIVKVTSPDIIRLVAQVRAMATVVRWTPIPPPVQTQLERLNIVRAVRGTLGIGASDLSEEEVGLIIDAPAEEAVLGPGREIEEQEVRNAETSMELIARRLREYPNALISENLIADLHEILTSGIKYPSNRPGRYRTDLDPAGDMVSFPEHAEVPRVIANFVHWFNNNAPATWDPVIRALAAHFYLISIQPFGDGNGRCARAVESYLLHQAGISARGFYSLANFYHRRRTEYAEVLDHVRFRSDPDITPFISFGLDGLVEELTSVQGEILAALRRISFRDFARETLSSVGKAGTPGGERQLALLIELSQGPVSVRRLRSGKHALSNLYRAVTSKTLMRDIDFLKRRNLVFTTGDLLEANLGVMAPSSNLPALWN